MLHVLSNQLAMILLSYCISILGRVVLLYQTDTLDQGLDTRRCMIASIEADSFCV